MTSDPGDTRKRSNGTKERRMVVGKQAHVKDTNNREKERMINESNEKSG